MKQAAWLASNSPRQMLTNPRQTIRPFSDRKLRLFAVACCRRIWDLLHDERSRSAVLALERFAEGAETETRMLDHASDSELALSALRASFWELQTQGLEKYHQPFVLAAQAVFQSMQSLPGARGYPTPLSAMIANAVGNAAAARTHHPDHDYRPPTESHEMFSLFERDLVYDEEIASQANLLRDILGNPFRGAIGQPITIKPQWATADVLAIAATIDKGGDFSTIPILGDALEEAGCDREDMLIHCRSSDEHVRGCWVLDAVLGRA